MRYCILIALVLFALPSLALDDEDCAPIVWEGETYTDCDCSGWEYNSTDLSFRLGFDWRRNPPRDGQHCADNWRLRLLPNLGEGGLDSEKLAGYIKKQSGFDGDVCDIKMKMVIPWSQTNGPSRDLTTGFVFQGTSQVLPSDVQPIATPILYLPEGPLIEFYSPTTARIPGAQTSVTIEQGGTGYEYNEWLIHFSSSDGTDLFEDSSNADLGQLDFRFWANTPPHLGWARCTGTDYLISGNATEPPPDVPYLHPSVCWENFDETHIENGTLAYYIIDYQVVDARECGTNDRLDVDIFAENGKEITLLNAVDSAFFPYPPTRTNNCSNFLDPMSRDEDQDGYGTACDADYDNDFSVVGGPDFGAFIACFGKTWQDAEWDDATECRQKDHNGDGSVGGPDFGIFTSSFGKPPGPSNLHLYKQVGWPFGAEAYDCDSPPAETTGLQPTPSANTLATPTEEEVWVVEVDSQSNVATEIAHGQGRKGKLKKTFRGRAFTGFSMKLPNKGAVRALANRPNVKRVWRDVDIPVAVVAAWGIDRIDQASLPLSNGYSTGDGEDGDGVDVFILDTGIDTGHSEFTGRLSEVSYNAYTGVEGLAGQFDDHGHGTHVASTVAGATLGVATGATIHSIKMCDDKGGCASSAIVDGLDWLIDTMIAEGYTDVVANMSLGGMHNADYINEGVCAGIANGIHYALAGGNNYSADACGFTPARVAQALTAAASQNTDQAASFSNKGACIDTYAPGIRVEGAELGGTVVPKSGTSMASPHVAGTIALYLGRNPGDTPAQAHSWVVSNTTPDKITNNRNDINNDNATPNRMLCVKVGGC